MKLFEHPDFEQAIVRAADHFRPRMMACSKSGCSNSFIGFALLRLPFLRML